MHTYPTADELRAMGETLEWDVYWWSARLAREYTTNAHCAPNIPLSELPRRAHRKAPDAPLRVFASSYVGVSVYRERWYISNWAIASRPKRGRSRPRTDQGERWAAQDRARALGRDYVEMRDGTRIPYIQAEPEEMAG